MILRAEDIYLLKGAMWNGMLYDEECLWPGWTTECEVVRNGVKKSYGVKWWREIAAWCGMSWCDFKCFVVWIDKVMCSVQSSLLFVY